MNRHGEEQSDAGSTASDSSLDRINQDIRRVGLVPRGVLRLDAGERHGAQADVATIVLIGTAGSEGWSAFAESPEQRDGGPHPLDCWSRRVIDGLAVLCGGSALYPFGEAPYWPFQRWAMLAEPIAPSPLGLLIHPEYGLWHSYRGALAFREAFPTTAVEDRESPCKSCAQRPCLSACPVGAFTSLGYDAERCAAHLRSEDGRDCMEGGCLARRSCPVGVDHRPHPDQAGFHMRAFLAARDAERV